MKQLSITIIAFIASIVLFTACKKKNDATYVSVKQVQIGALITSDTLCGAITGTMVSGKTYVLTCPVTINAKDTVLMQRGVTINVVNPQAYILVQGAFISLGTKDSANWITVKSITKQDNSNTANNPSSDPAYTSSNLWLGIQCDTMAKLCVLKWTHVEFVGAVFGTTPPMSSNKAGSNAYSVYFTNPNGLFVFEDSWMYGGVDDGMRPNGKFIIQRSTFEKEGYIGGDCINPKQGGVGIASHNMFIGCATNGTKASSKGSSLTAPTTQCDFYNNTYVNGGFRQQQTGRGGDINYEQGAFGQSYNNLIVDCKFGFRIVKNPAPDTAHCFYGYNLSYGDADSIVNQFYPVAYYSKFVSTNIPNPASAIPATDTLGQSYTAHSWVGANDPMFVNYTLGSSANINIDYVNGFDFHLRSTSPAIGKGYTSFTPHIPAGVYPDPVFGPTTISPPGADIGCYQSTGSFGNQH
jgi:hypothetical protein